MKRANEALVGAAVLGALVLAVAGSIWLSQRSFGRRELLREAMFRTIGGLQKGGPVLMRGVRIGHVDQIALGDSNWVYVTFKISSDARVPDNPVAIIASTTLFGDWGVDVVDSAGVPDDPTVKKDIADARKAARGRWPGATLPAIGELTAQAGRIAGDIATIAGRVEDAFDSNSARRLQGAFIDLSNLSRRMSVIVRAQETTLTAIGRNIDTGATSLARSARLIERTLLRADSATSNSQLQNILRNADTVTSDLRRVADNLKSVSEVARNNQAAIGRIIANTDSVIARVQAGDGTLGRLARDTTLYAEAVVAMRSLRELLQDMQRTPRKYFSFSVF